MPRNALHPSDDIGCVQADDRAVDVILRVRRAKHGLAVRHRLDCRDPVAPERGKLIDEDVCLPHRPQDIFVGHPLPDPQFCIVGPMAKERPQAVRLHGSERLAEEGDDAVRPLPFANRGKVYEDRPRIAGRRGRIPDVDWIRNPHASRQPFS